MIISLIFSVLFAITLILYFIGTFKPVSSLGKISSYFLLPFSFAIALPFFFSTLPDSHHAMTEGCMAVFFASLIPLSKGLLAKVPKITNKLETVLFLLNTFFWITLYNSTVLLIRVLPFIPVLFVIIYFSIFVFFLIVFKIKSFIEIFVFFILLGFASSLNYISLITLLFSKNLSGIFCFTGSLILVFYILIRKIAEKKAFKFSSLLETLTLIAGNIFILSGTTLLQYI